MAKFAPPEQSPDGYRPVREQLARDVMGYEPPSEEEGKTPEVKEIQPPTPQPPQEMPPVVASVEVVKQKPKAVSGGKKKRKNAAEASKDELASKRKEFTQEKRMLITPLDEKLFVGLVAGITESLRVKVKESNVLRACLSLLLHAQEEILKQCSRMEPLERPRYDEHTSIVAFEEELTRIFDTAIRNTKSLD